MKMAQRQIHTKHPKNQSKDTKVQRRVSTQGQRIQWCTKAQRMLMDYAKRPRLHLQTMVGRSMKL